MLFLITVCKSLSQLILKNEQIHRRSITLICFYSYFLDLLCSCSEWPPVNMQGSACVPGLPVSLALFRQERAAVRPAGSPEFEARRLIVSCSSQLGVCSGPSTGSFPAAACSKSKPDTTDSLSSTRAHWTLRIRVFELPQLRLHTHTHTRLNMKPDVSPCETATYVFDLRKCSEIGKCKAPWYRSKLFYLDDFGMNLPLTYCIWEVVETLKQLQFYHYTVKQPKCR